MTQPGREAHGSSSDDDRRRARAALFFHFDNFWGLVVAGLAFVWAAFGLLPVMDGTWRLKAGFVASVFLGAVIALWPTIHNLSHGKVPLPAYVRDRVDFAMAAGARHQGGVRLVYTVEVEEAIRDKRDHYADDMRQELATSFGFHSGEGRVTREELREAGREGPRRDARVGHHPPDLQGSRRTSRSSTTASTSRSSASWAEPRAPSPTRSRSRSARTSSRQIRDRAVAQAKDTINRRIDRWV